MIPDVPVSLLTPFLRLGWLKVLLVVGSCSILHVFGLTALYGRPIYFFTDLRFLGPIFFQFALASAVASLIYNAVSFFFLILQAQRFLIRLSLKIGDRFRRIIFFTAVVVRVAAFAVTFIVAYFGSSFLFQMLLAVGVGSIVFFFPEIINLLKKKDTVVSAFDRPLDASQLDLQELKLVLSRKLEAMVPFLLALLMFFSFVAGIQKSESMVRRAELVEISFNSSEPKLTGYFVGVTDSFLIISSCSTSCAASEEFVMVAVGAVESIGWVANLADTIGADKP